MEHHSLLQDTSFWVLISMIIFIAVVVSKGRGAILGFLDARTARIQASIAEAERLRIEAQNLLADMQKKHREALETSRKLIDNAKATAERLQAEAAVKLEEAQKRREEQLNDRIARAETTAITELRQQAADLAAQSAEILLHDALSKRGGKLVDDTIASLSKAG